jgi:hypothetical protein
MKETGVEGGRRIQASLALPLLYSPPELPNFILFWGIFPKIENETW